MSVNTFFFLVEQKPSLEKSWIVQDSTPYNMKDPFDGGIDMWYIIMPFHISCISLIKGAI